MVNRKQDISIRDIYPHVGGDGIRVTISEPKEGVNKEKLSRALNLILSEDDLRGYMIKIKGDTKGRDSGSKKHPIRNLRS
jgi:hypothetical protein